MKCQRQLYAPGVLGQLRAKWFTFSKLPSIASNVYNSLWSVRLSWSLPLHFSVISIVCRAQETVLISFSLVLERIRRGFYLSPRIFFFLIHAASDMFCFKLGVCTTSIAHSGRSVYKSLVYLYRAVKNKQSNNWFFVVIKAQKEIDLVLKVQEGISALTIMLPTYTKP